MTPEQDERFVAACERIAEAFDFIAGTLESIDTTIARHHAKTFPGRRIPAEATITHILTEEERLRQDQGQTNESLKDWTSLDEEEIGPREKEWNRQQAEREAKAKKV